MQERPVDIGVKTPTSTEVYYILYYIPFPRMCLNVGMLDNQLFYGLDNADRLLAELSLRRCPSIVHWLNFQVPDASR